MDGSVLNEICVSVSVAFIGRASDADSIVIYMMI